VSPRQGKDQEAKPTTRKEAKSGKGQCAAANARRKSAKALCMVRQKGDPRVA
jgi:hypothetical protein